MIGLWCGVLRMIGLWRAVMRGLWCVVMVVMLLRGGLHFLPLSFI